MSNYSPLRYPGGKSALYPVISSVIKSHRMKHCIYVEPFAGGAGIAWSLLIDGVVDRVIINDADKAVYSFWRAIMESTQWFVEKIRTTPITVNEWRKQRDILRNSKKYSKELGFAMFFLNRTNRSGILDAGPIGGYDQAGEYKIDCRFNRDELIRKILKIAEYRSKTKIYNQDISTFLKRFLPQGNENNEIFVYFDPPYYEKGQRLYMNFFSSKDHERLRDSVALLDCRWIMTYDDKPEILWMDAIILAVVKSAGYFLMANAPLQSLPMLPAQKLKKHRQGIRNAHFQFMDIVKTAPCILKVAPLYGLQPPPIINN